jgi:nicotinate-nucleotide adenylyltransferase
MRRVALFGGSFDPPTLGHGAVVANVLASGLVDEVWFVPAGGDRYDRPLVVAVEDRRALVEHLIADLFPGDPRVRLEAAQLEGRLPGSKTIDLVDFLRAAYPSTQFFFVIGADNIDKVGAWREAERLVTLIRFLAVPRVGEVIPAIIPPYVTVLEGGRHSDIASTTVRERLQRGEAIDDVVPPGVARYIAERGLYRSVPP